MKTEFERGHRRDEDVEIDVLIVRETTLAFLIDDGDIRDWIPKSKIEDPEH